MSFSYKHIRVECLYLEKPDRYFNTEGGRQLKKLQLDLWTAILNSLVVTDGTLNLLVTYIWNRWKLISRKLKPICKMRSGKLMNSLTNSIGKTRCMVTP